jgi:hypothetical protein
MPVFQPSADAASGQVNLEALSQPLYDFQSVVGGAVTAFYQQPNGRSLLFTNLESAGSLTWPKRFSVKAFRFVPAANAAAADLVTLYTLAFARLKVGEKDYFVSPLFLITPGVGLEVSATAAVTGGTATPGNFGAAAANFLAPATLLHNGRPDHRNIYVLQHQVWIPSVQNFTFRVEMNSGAFGGTSTNGTVTTATSVGAYVFLEGEYFREVQ